MTAVVTEDLDRLLDSGPPACQCTLYGKPCGKSAAWWLYTTTEHECSDDHGCFTCEPCRVLITKTLGTGSFATCNHTGVCLELAWRPV